MSQALPSVHLLICPHNHLKVSGNTFQMVTQCRYQSHNFHSHRLRSASRQTRKSQFRSHPSLHQKTHKFKKRKDDLLSLTLGPGRTPFFLRLKLNFSFKSCRRNCNSECPNWSIETSYWTRHMKLELKTNDSALWQVTNINTLVWLSVSTIFLAIPV